VTRKIRKEYEVFTGFSYLLQSIESKSTPLKWVFMVSEFLPIIDIYGVCKCFRVKDIGFSTVSNYQTVAYKM
jgi:hypothetical protein